MIAGVIFWKSWWLFYGSLVVAAVPRRFASYGVSGGCAGLLCAAAYDDPMGLAWITVVPVPIAALAVVYVGLGFVFGKTTDNAAHVAGGLTGLLIGAWT